MESAGNRLALASLPTTWTMRCGVQAFADLLFTADDGGALSDASLFFLQSSPPPLSEITFRIPSTCSLLLSNVADWWRRDRMRGKWSQAACGRPTSNTAACMPASQYAIIIIVVVCSM